MSRTPTSAILGRQAELDEIERFLDAVVGGSSRLAAAVRSGGHRQDHALDGRDRRLPGQRGFQVVSAQPTEVETGLAFAALGDLLGPLLEAPIPDLPEPQRDALDAALLRAVDRRRRRIRSAFRSRPSTSFALLRPKRPSSSRSTMCRWLDEASVPRARLLHPAPPGGSRRFPRSRGARPTLDQPLPHWLATLPPDRFTRLDVGPLSMDETDALLRGRLELKLSRPVLTRLHSISGGTPFYAIELGRELQARGTWATPEALEVPRSLDRLVGARIAALEPSADEVALFAAALAPPDGARPRRRARLGADAAPGWMPPSAAGVLEVAGDAVRFTHPLLAAAAYSRAGPDRRRSVHERLAEVVTEPEERARHLARTAVGRRCLGRASARGRIRRSPPGAALRRWLPNLSVESARLTPARRGRRPASAPTSPRPST